MDFTLAQGRTERIAIGPITKANGDIVNLTGMTVRVMVKNSLVDGDAQAIADYTLAVAGDGTPTSTPAGRIVFGRPNPADTDVMIDATVSSGYITVEFDDNDTRDWTPGGKPWECVLLPGDGRSWTLRSGTITVEDTLIDDPEA